nr:unnamed protein product [Spirometra erinaceieuropaei]
MRNSPYHAIAKWLAEKLKPVQRQLAPRSYRDTFEFIDDIKDLNVNGMVMFSLDVSSLFTNVPVTETVGYLCDFLSTSQQEIGIPVNTLKELLLRCTLNVQFLFDNQLYRQVDGVAMGSPLGPLLADVFMGKLEKFQLSEQINKLKHYGRYVDDIFAIATAETDVATLLDAANQAHSSIKFTLEMETAGSLPFLDVLLSRRPDGSVRRSVYRKKTWSEQYTNFASFVYLQQKRNVVRCLAQRARKICSTDSIEEELRKITDFLRENGYPERFIEKNIAERPIKPATPTAEKKTLFLKVPFQGDAAIVTSAMSQPLIVKAKYEKEIRTLPVYTDELSFDELHLMISRMFKGHIAAGDDLILKYVDSDGDLITLGDAADLDLALLENKKLCVHVSSRPQKDSEHPSTNEPFEHEGNPITSPEGIVLIDELAVLESPASQTSAAPAREVELLDDWACRKA